MSRAARENRVFPSAGGDAPEYARILRVLRGRNVALPPVLLSLCRAAGGGWRKRQAGVSAPDGGGLSFCHAVFVVRAASSGGKSSFPVRVFSLFLTDFRRFAACLPRLCGKKSISFRKDGNFFPQRNRVFGGEMRVGCSFRTRFLTFGPLDRRFFVLCVLRIPPDSGLCVVFWGASVPKCQPAFTVSFSSLSGISVHGRPDR